MNLQMSHSHVEAAGTSGGSIVRGALAAGSFRPTLLLADRNDVKGVGSV